MKTKIFKKLIAVLCAATMSASIVAPAGAVEYSGGNPRSDTQKTNLNNLNKTIEKSLNLLKQMDQKVSNKHSQNDIDKAIAKSLITNIQDNLKRLYGLSICSRTAIDNAYNSMSSFPSKLYILLNLIDQKDINSINGSLTELDKTCTNILEYAKIFANNNNNNNNNHNNNNNNNMINNNNFNNMNMVKMQDILNNHPENPAPPVEPIDISSCLKEWWDEAKTEIDGLIAEAEYYMRKKNVNLDNLYKKYEKLFAGHQSSSNCWLFSSQNVANYFLNLDGQTPIRKIGWSFGEPTDVVEKEFIKRLPVNADLLRHAQNQYVMQKYLNTYGVKTENVSIFNYEPNNAQRKPLMKKFAHFLLVQHFSNSDIPVIVNVGYHWITIAGIDIKTKKALVLDSLDSTPKICDLNNVTDRISNMQYNKNNADINRILMLFPNREAVNDDIESDTPGMNWNMFKSLMISSASRKN